MNTQFQVPTVMNDTPTVTYASVVNKYKSNFNLKYIKMLVSRHVSPPRTVPKYRKTTQFTFTNQLNFQLIHLSSYFMTPLGFSKIPNVKDLLSGCLVGVFLILMGILIGFSVGVIRDLIKQEQRFLGLRSRWSLRSFESSRWKDS